MAKSVGFSPPAAKNCLSSEILIVCIPHAGPLFSDVSRSSLGISMIELSIVFTMKSWERKLSVFVGS